MFFLSAGTIPNQLVGLQVNLKSKDRHMFASFSNFRNILIDREGIFELHFFVPRNFLWVKGVLLLVGIDPISMLTRSAPFDAILRTAPLVFTVGFMHGCSYHFQSIMFSFGGWIVRPVGRDRIVYLQIMICFCPSISRVVMYKYTRVPRTIQALGSAMKALGRFIKELSAE